MSEKLIAFSDVPLFCRLCRYRVDLFPSGFSLLSLFNRLLELADPCFQIIPLFWVGELRNFLFQGSQFIRTKKLRRTGGFGFCQSAQLLLKVLNFLSVLFFCEPIDELFDLRLFCGYGQFPLSHILVDFVEFVP